MEASKRNTVFYTCLDSLHGLWLLLFFEDNTKEKLVSLYGHIEFSGFFQVP